MRWDRQRIDEPGQQPLLGLSGLLRSVSPPEFRGITFHEVRARSALNKVPGGALPFSWTVNPYRGCSHACTYCFARNTHTYLDFDAGRDFDSQVVVKTNVAEVLGRELARPGWTGEHVAMGTNTDPYQRAEGRYRLMPGVIRALAASGTGFSVLTKGTLLSRDLPLLRSVATEVPIGLGVSIAVLDPDLQRRLEPGTPAPRARLDLVRRISDAGIRCNVMVAPVLPGLTDSAEQLDGLLGEIAAAGADSATVLPLHLRPGAREWFAGWLAAEHPDLRGRYRELYGSGTYAARGYRVRVSALAASLARKHGLLSSESEVVDEVGQENSRAHRGHRETARTATVARSVADGGEQLSLLGAAAGKPGGAGPGGIG